MSKVKSLRKRMKHLRDVDVEEEKQPDFKFKVGDAGVTGEIYWTIGVVQGRRMSMMQDPRTGDYPVFQDEVIAEKVVADLEKHRTQNNQFPDVDHFVKMKLEVGKESKIIRPNAGNIVLPTGYDVGKFGGLV